LEPKNGAREEDREEKEEKRDTCAACIKLERDAEVPMRAHLGSWTAEAADRGKGGGRAMRGPALIAALPRVSSRMRILLRNLRGVSRAAAKVAIKR
jgi:hypothetical protein